MRPPLCLLPLAVLLACQSSAGIDHAFKDEGKVCAFPSSVDPGNAFLPPTDPVMFSAGGPATITVMAPTCLSSSCSKDRKAECSVVLEGNVLQVSSHASYHDEGNACTADCGALVATCVTPPLPAGTYTLQHGGNRIALTIPSTVAVPCVGKAP
jgi:hypothetical protein